MKPRVFIGSSAEGVKIAEAIQYKLDRTAEVVLWTDNVFRLSSTAYDALEKQLRSVHYGVFVLTEDDLVRIRGRHAKAPRDNVIFELGLFAGRLGLEKTFIVHPRNSNLRIPSDLLGVTCATYEIHASGNLYSSVAAACTQIRDEIQSGHSKTRIPWAHFTEWIKDLSKLLMRFPSSGGFSFDVIVGVTGGGLVAADMLSRCYGRRHPVVGIWADWHSRYPVASFDPPSNWVNRHLLRLLSRANVRNILVMDDISRTGQTLVAAKKFLQAHLPAKLIKSAVVICDPTYCDRFDYYAAKIPTVGLQLPYSELDA